MAFVFPEDKADFLAPNGVMYSWDGDKWRTKSFKVDVEGDSGLMASVQRVEDNLDLLQDTVSTGEYFRAAKPGDPTGPKEGEAAFLQDGGAEATTFAEVENILLNKKGKGPYANFDDAKKGDYLLLQSAVDGDFGLYVIRNATTFDTFWDFGLEICAGKAVGTVPEISEGIFVRTSRPTFTVAQDTPPDFSSTGQLWFDTNAHTLKVWDEEAQVFVETGGDGSDVHVGEDAPADPSEGGLWYDSTRLELFVYYVDGDGNGGWVPCSPLGARVEQGEIIQQQLLERVSEGEKAQVELQNKVNALEGAVGEHRLLFTTTNSNVRPGEFNLKNMEMGMVNTISSATFISISETDADGNAIDRDKFQPGDVIRIISLEGETSDLKIESGGTGFYKIGSATGSLDRLSEIPYNFVLLSSFDPSGLATIDYVDAQDETKVDKAGDTLTGTLTIDQPSGTNFKVKKNGVDKLKILADGKIFTNYDANLDSDSTTVINRGFLAEHYLDNSATNSVTTSFRIKSGNNTLISTSGNSLGLYNLKAPTDASHAVNLGYLEEKYLKLGGGTMTGALACERPGTGNTYLFSCKAQGLPEGNQVAFRVTGDGAVKAGHSTASPFMASAANDVVTKRYLEEQIAAVAGTERIYGFRDIGDTATLHQKKITYSRQDGGQLTIPLVPESGPAIASPTSYFSFKSWTGQFSLVVEIAPGNWRTIFMGVTSEIRHSSTHTTPFFEVRIPDSGLFVNAPNAEYYDLPCKLKIAGFL